MNKVTDIVAISVEDIIEDPSNRAVGGVGDVEALAESIKALGQIVPAVVVRSGGKYRMVDGHRRLRAIKHAGQSFIGAIVFESQNEALDVLEGLAVNELREDLSEADRARAFQRVLFDLPADEVAKATGLDKGKAAYIQRVARHVKPEWVTSLDTLSAIGDYELTEGAKKIIQGWDGDADGLLRELQQNVKRQEAIAFCAEKYPDAKVLFEQPKHTVTSIAGRWLSTQPCGCDGYAAVYAGGWWNPQHPFMCCTKPDNHADEIEARNAAQDAADAERTSKWEQQRIEREQQERQRSARLSWLWEARRSCLEDPEWLTLAADAVVFCPVDAYEVVVVAFGTTDDYADAPAHDRRKLLGLYAAYCADGDDYLSERYRDLLEDLHCPAELMEGLQ